MAELLGSRCNCGARQHDDAQRHSPRCASGLERERCEWCGKLAQALLMVEPSRKIAVNDGKGSFRRKIVAPKQAPVCDSCATRLIAARTVPVADEGTQLTIEGV